MHHIDAILLISEIHQTVFVEQVIWIQLLSLTSMNHIWKSPELSLTNCLPAIMVNKCKLRSRKVFMFKGYSCCMFYSYVLVTIICKAREMVAHVKTSKVFNGKIYAKSKPNS